MSVPVLMYHHVLPSSGFIASSVEEFEKQMEFLAQNGYKSLTSDEFFRYKKGEFKAPKKSLLITFDDGWKNNFVYAYPILKKLGLKATIFITTGWIEKSSKKNSPFDPAQHRECKKIAPKDPSKVILSWDDLQKMRDVFDIHSHTHTHRDDYFGALDWKEDLITSKNLLKKRLGIDSKHLCWPRGKYDKKLIDLAKECGYEILYTTKRGINKADGDTNEIKRLAAKKDWKWLRKNLFIFSNDILGTLYAAVKK